MISPSSFRLDSQKRLVLREGGGCLSVFGLPFLGAGLFMLLIALRIVPVDNAEDLQGFEYLVFFFMCLVFTAVGASLVFGRKWLIVDLPRGIVTASYGLLTPMKHKTERLRDYKIVALRFKEGDSDTADRYPLSLEDATGGKVFSLTSPTDFGKAREMAAALANYLSFPFEDRTSSTASVYNPKQGAAPEAATSALPQALPPRPADLRSSITDSNGILEIFIPAPAIFSGLVVVIVIVAIVIFSDAFSSVKCLVMNGLKFPADFMHLGFFAVVALVVLSALLSNLPVFRKNKKFGALVKVTKDGLTLEEKIPGKSLSRTFPASDILAVDVIGFDRTKAMSKKRLAVSEDAKNPFNPGSASPFSPSGGNMPSWFASLINRSNRLTLKTNRDIIVFAYGLTHGEASYISALINRRLRGNG